ncbi:hypothetical protein EDC04DRAFT_2561358, partial [Pisolithus marmoratus]
KTIVIDYLNGDSVPEYAMTVRIPVNDADSGMTFGDRRNEQTRSNIDKVVAALKEQGVKDFGVTGYCFGGRYSFDLAFENIIKVTVASHPSLLQAPEDLERSKASLLINSCTVDLPFPREFQAEADRVIGNSERFTATYRRECFEGFAIRGDRSKPEVKVGREGSFKATVWFFKMHL